jgi:hypothetical protein
MEATVIEPQADQLGRTVMVDLETPQGSDEPLVVLEVARGRMETEWTRLTADEARAVAAALTEAADATDAPDDGRTTDGA